MEVKKCFLQVTLLLLFLPFLAHSQQTSLSVDAMAAKEVRFLKAKLQLDSVQQVQVFNKFKVLHAANQTTVSDSSTRAAKVKHTQKEYEQSLKQILTNEQFEKFKDLSDERMGKHILHHQKKPKKRVPLKKQD